MGFRTIFWNVLVDFSFFEELVLLESDLIVHLLCIVIPLSDVISLTQDWSCIVLCTYWVQLLA